MTDTSALSILRETKVLSEDDLARLAADPDAGSGLVCVSDHVNAWFEDGGVMIENPTAYPAVVKVMIETEEDRKRPLGLLWQDRFLRVRVGPGEVLRAK